MQRCDKHFLEIWQKLGCLTIPVSCFSLGSACKSPAAIRGTCDALSLFQNSIQLDPPPDPFDPTPPESKCCEILSLSLTLPRTVPLVRCSPCSPKRRKQKTWTRSHEFSCLLSRSIEHEIPAVWHGLLMPETDRSWYSSCRFRMKPRHPKTKMPIFPRLRPQWLGPTWRRLSGHLNANTTPASLAGAKIAAMRPSSLLHLTPHVAITPNGHLLMQFCLKLPLRFRCIEVGFRGSRGSDFSSRSRPLAATKRNLSLWFQSVHEA